MWVALYEANKLVGFAPDQLLSGGPKVPTRTINLPTGFYPVPARFDPSYTNVAR